MKKKRFSKIEKYPSNYFIVNLRNTLNNSPDEKKFIPFVQERDGLGRLIKPPSSLLKKSNILYSQINPLTHENPSKFRSLIKMKVETMQQNINDQFQFHQPNKYNQNRKNIIRVRKNSPSTKKTKTEEIIIMTLPTQQNSDQTIKLKSMTSMSPKYGSPRREKSNILLQTVNIPRQLSMRQNGTRKNEYKTEQQVFFPTNSPKTTRKCNKNVLLFDNMKLKQQTNIVELKRYNTYKTLSLKLSDNIQAGHTMFFQKMLESKKLSFQIKMNIEST